MAAFSILSCEYENSVRIPTVLSADPGPERAIQTSRCGFFALPCVETHPREGRQGKEGDFDER